MLRSPGQETLPGARARTSLALYPCLFTQVCAKTAKALEISTKAYTGHPARPCRKNAERHNNDCIESPVPQGSFHIFVLYPASFVWALILGAPIRLKIVLAGISMKLCFYFYIHLSHSYTRGHLNTTFMAHQVVGTGTGGIWGWGVD